MNRQTWMLIVAAAYVALMMAGISSLAGEAVAADAPATSNSTAQWMIEQERAWAEQACGHPWVVAELLAEDFHGTAPKGSRYDKPKEAPTYDPATFATDCRLLDADVRFFGSNVAVVYGSETKTVSLPDAKHEQRCLVWTDTWLKRNGKWQIIAVQDAHFDCPSDTKAASPAK
ncbi:MAG TPA: nuclear transport factor 2 family protein [Steroidobacteraceae bacterium]|jgi:hypothetical protein|nr:nuclear transport factor 2 family protein [Steroidobacteraceae bacterium]